MRIAVFAMIAVVILGSFAAAEVRTWRDQANKPLVDAEFVELRQGKVVTKRPDGRSVSFPLERLSGEDRQYVQEKTSAPTIRPAPDTLRWEVLSVSVGKPLSSGVSNLDATGLAEIYQVVATGTRVCLVLSGSEQRLINMVDGASRITRFQDDVGTNLISPPNLLPQSRIIACRAAQQSNTCVVELRSAAVPAKEAKKLILEGEIVFRASNELKTIESHDLDVAAGDTMNVGTATWTITKKVPFNTTFDTHKMGLALKPTASFAPIKEVTFLTTSGERISYNVVEGDQFGSGCDRVYTAIIGLTRDVPKLRLRVVFWDKPEQIRVPFAIETDLGL
jgi:hypothetical protein